MGVRHLGGVWVSQRSRKPFFAIFALGLVVRRPNGWVARWVSNSPPPPLLLSKTLSSPLREGCLGGDGGIAETEESLLLLLATAFFLRPVCYSGAAIPSVSQLWISPQYIRRVQLASSPSALQRLQRWHVGTKALPAAKDVRSLCDCVHRVVPWRITQSQKEGL